jgi:hypothetical protein
MPPEPRPLLLEKRERARVCACVGRACRSSRRRRLAPRCPFTPDLCSVGERNLGLDCGIHLSLGRGSGGDASLPTFLPLLLPV